MLELISTQSESCRVFFVVVRLKRKFLHTKKVSYFILKGEFEFR